MSIRKVIGILGLLVLSAFGGKAFSKDEGNLAPYPSLWEFYQEIKNLASANPDLIELEEIGKSVEGRPLYLLRFGFNKGPSQPKALIAGGIHAGEFIGARVAMASAQWLSEKSKTEPELRDLLHQIEIDILPVQNPDGYHRVYEHKGKGNGLGTRKNARGVDLNRNFPVVPGAKSHHPLAGNRRTKSNYYMGPEPLSEPETKAMAELLNTDHYFVVFNLHSMAGKFLYPYTHSKSKAPDQELFIEIGKAFVSAQKHFPYQIQQSYSWYPTLGDPDDYNYLKLHIPSFTIEVSTLSSNLLDRGLSTLKIFWMANPGKKYEEWINNDAPALISAIKKAYELTGGKPLEPKAEWAKQ